MKHAYLEVTYRKGRPLAAYYYLPRKAGDTSARTEPAAGGLLVDYSADDRLEIPSPSQLNVADLKRLLEELRQAPIAREEFAPITSA